MRYAYLAGPITGVTYDQANGWRNDPNLLNELALYEWETLSPVATVAATIKGPLEPWFEGHDGRIIVEADVGMILKSNALLVNLLDHRGDISVGTVAEIGFAYGSGIPIHVARQPSGPYDHPFIEGMATTVSHYWEDAVSALLAS